MSKVKQCGGGLDLLEEMEQQQEPMSYSFTDKNVEPGITNID